MACLCGLIIEHSRRFRLDFKLSIHHTRVEKKRGKKMHRRHGAWRGAEMEIKPNVVQGEYQGWSFELLYVFLPSERYSMCGVEKKSRVRHKNRAVSRFNAQLSVWWQTKEKKKDWNEMIRMLTCDIRNGIELRIEIEHDLECLHVLHLAAGCVWIFNMDQIKQLYDARASRCGRFVFKLKENVKHENSLFTTRALALLHPCTCAKAWITLPLL